MRRSRLIGTVAGLATAAIAVAAGIAAAPSALAQQRAAAPAAAPAPVTAAALPSRELTGYWQNFVNGATNLRIRDVSTQYDLIVVSFAEATGQPGGVGFALDPGLSSALGGYTKAQFIADIAAKKAAGANVIISVGGETGRVAVNDAASATNFANTMRSLITEYGFQGVDIDLENGLNPTYMASALRQLRTAVGSGLIITMAPQTIDVQGPGGSYMQLISSIKDIVTVVHTQYYNSGSMLGCDGRLVSQGNVDFITGQACILLGVLRPDQVALGLPASPRGAGSGYVAPSVVNNALDCLAKGTNCGAFKPSQTWPGIRGAMTWSINWDALNGYNFANTVGPHLDTLPGGGPTNPPSPTPSPTRPPTPTPSPTVSPTTPPANCGTLPAWNRTAIYVGNDQVSHNGRKYRAKWWTQGEVPGTTGEWGVWADLGPC